MVFMVLHIGSALAILIVAGVLLLRKKATGFWGCYVVGWMWQVLLSLPAGIWQSLKGWPHIDVSGSSFWTRLTTPLFGWPFNAGGFTVRSLFEATVEPLEWLVGHRSATVMSNMPYYAFLLLIQGSILAALFAWRHKKKRTYKDWFVICLGVLFLLNSVLNVTWFWAGT
jgi:hypothetical protein